LRGKAKQVVRSLGTNARANAIDLALRLYAARHPIKKARAYCSGLVACDPAPIALSTPPNRLDADTNQ
jgi:hypothetical protein